MKISSEKARPVEVDIFDAEEAIGLVESLNWYVVPGIFNNYKIPELNEKELPNYYEILEEPKLGDQVIIEGLKASYQGNHKFEILSDQEEDDNSMSPYKQYLANVDANKHITTVRGISRLLYFNRQFLKRLNEHITAKQVDIIYINAFLTSLQAKGLKKTLTAMQAETNPEYDNWKDNVNLVIVDRLGVILQIFNKRAGNELAKLQTALVYIKYAKTIFTKDNENFTALNQILNFDVTQPREVRMQLASAKQSGHKGSLSGEGESQQELQKRLYKDLHNRIKQKIEDKKIASKRFIEKGNAKKNALTVALIGYTNAGKSAILNMMAKREVVDSKDMLFQTLKTINRRVHVRGNFDVIMVDTIGFINNLPYELVPPFLSTIEHVKNADLVLHIRDIAHPNTEGQLKGVEEVMEKLDMGHILKENRIIEVRNKVDLYLQKNPDIALEELESTGEMVYISATQKLNIDMLKETLQKKIYKIFNCYEKRYKIATQDYDTHANWFKELVNKIRRHQRFL